MKINSRGVPVLMQFTAMCCLLVSAVVPATAPAQHVSSSRRHVTDTHWVASWSSAQQVPEPANVMPAAMATDVTLRQTVHLSLGGSQLRVRLSNAFGTQPLHLDSVHLGTPSALASSRIQPGSDHALTFNGMPDVTIPAGAEYLSDPVSQAVVPRSSVAISLHFAAAPAIQTGHPGSRATSWFLHGDHTGDVDLPAATPVDHWYLLAGVEVAAQPGSTTVVALGDSITDGHGATTNANDRWTDVLAARLAPRHVGVVNAGIGGNHLLTDGLGPNVLARFDRDVLAHAGVRTVILLEGINDLGALSRQGQQPAAVHEALVTHMIGALQQVINRAHAQGIRVLGATITPDTGSDYYHPAAANEADRQQVNAWIRTPGHFDGVIDSDRILADPAQPARLRPAFDSGDHLHPSPAGYAAMANSIPLNLLTGR